MPTPRRAAALLFVLLLGSYAYFFQGGGWNENSRLDLARALVDRGTLAIDAYHLNTFDKSRRGLSFYSDKAPGLGLLAAPVYAVVRAVHPRATDRAGEHRLVVLALYFATLVLSGAAVAGTAVLIQRLARRLGTSLQAATVAALSFGLGSIAFPMATVFFSHALTGFLLFFSFSLLDEDAGGGGRCVVAGAAAALAVLCEYPSLPAVALLGLYALRGPAGRRRLLRFALPGLLFALVLAVYLALAFGNPFRLGYQMLADPASAQNMNSTGFLGMRAPHLKVVAELLVGNYRGLLYYCPVLILGILGLVWAIRVPAARRPAALSAAFGVYYLLMVSSYAWWEGGSSFGSRHLLPMVPFLCWPLALLADRVGWVVTPVAVLSGLIALAATAVQPKPAGHIQAPLFDEILPGLRAGKLGRNNVCPLYSDPAPAEHPSVLVDVDGEAHDAFNLGQRAGLRGGKSLLPLFMFWLVIGFFLREAQGRRPAPSGPAPPGATPGPVPGAVLGLVALALGASTGGCTGSPPPGTPLRPSATWLAATNCSATGSPVADADAMARMADPPGERACGFVGRWLSVRPGVPTTVALEIHDPYPDAAPAGLVEQRLYVDGAYVWQIDLGGLAFTGWRRASHKFVPRWPVVELRLEVATRGMEDPGGDWGRRTASAVRALEVLPAGAGR